MLDSFIAGTLDYEFFTEHANEDRTKASKRRKFQANTIVATLEEYRKKPTYRPVDNTVPLPISVMRRPQTRSYYKTTGKPFVPQQLNRITFGVPSPVTQATDASSSPTQFGLEDLVAPPGADMVLDHRYRAAVFQIAGDTSHWASPCLVCGEQHPFDKCSTLNNVDYLKNHMIKFSNFLKRDTIDRLKLTGTVPPPPTGHSVNSLESADHHTEGADANLHAVSSNTRLDHRTEAAYNRDQHFHWGQK
jgi:hypothetical protein